MSSNDLDTYSRQAKNLTRSIYCTYDDRERLSAKDTIQCADSKTQRVFACVYARTNEVGMQRLKEKYGDCFSVISKSERIDSYNIELNLDKIWSSHFNEYSFPQIKRDFYNKKFLVSEGINLCPLVKVTHRIDTKFNIVLDTVNEVITAVRQLLFN